MFQSHPAPWSECYVSNSQTQSPHSQPLPSLFLHFGHAPLQLTSVSLPFKKSPSTSTYLPLASCRGFVLLDDCPHFVVWNPSTGAHKKISYSHIVSPSSDVQTFHLLGNVLLWGFGHDASNDDYLVVLAGRDKDEEDHFQYFSVTDDSWKNFGVALPNLAKDRVRRSGLFYNGAFHWAACPDHRGEFILVFDLKERRFSEMPIPEPLVEHFLCRLIELGGCLALEYYRMSGYGCEREIWVMKEYRVQSSWKLYGKFHMGFEPLGSSNDGGIIGFDFVTRGLCKYDVCGQKLEHCNHQQSLPAKFIVYTESLISLPNDSKA